MKALLLISILFLCNCSMAVRFDSPLKMSDEEFAAKVSSMVNPALMQLQKKHDELAKQVKK